MTRIDGVNPEEVDEYTRNVLQAQAKTWGRRCSTTWCTRDGLPSFIEEGEWHPHRLVILKLESIEQAKRWYQSEEYTAIKAIGHRRAHTQLILVQGV